MVITLLMLSAFACHLA